ncbi:MAG TPA: hypothetical protein EYQ73_01235 [Candidatus Poseidoniales archaeon]|jgi:hypothetical protein|nr:hypothetical protein [Candidatus Poseidoniales archaeon]HIL64711.1 hypothetical protein [Candidatus Poseidoniales archaeon]
MGWWANQHGKQLRIAATVTFASILLTSLSGLQLMILQDISGFEDFTSLAIVAIVIGIIGLSISAPAFANLKARANTLADIMNMSSSSELAKSRADGDECARILGGGHQETWNEFLTEKGLKRR